MNMSNFFSVHTFSGVIVSNNSNNGGLRESWFRNASC